VSNKSSKKPKLPKKKRSALMFEELEPRVLLSADLPIDLPGALANEPDEEESSPVLEASADDRLGWHADTVRYNGAGVYGG